MTWIEQATLVLLRIRQSSPWLFGTVAGPNAGDPTRRCLGKQCHRSVLGTIGGQGIVWKNCYRCGPFSLFSGQQSLHLCCKFATSLLRICRHTSSSGLTFLLQRLMHLCAPGCILLCTPATFHMTKRYASEARQYRAQ